MECTAARVGRHEKDAVHVLEPAVEAVVPPGALGLLHGLRDETEVPVRYVVGVRLRRGVARELAGGVTQAAARRERTPLSSAQSAKRSRLSLLHRWW